MFYKIVENGYITMIGSPNLPSNGVEITEEKHTELSEKIKTKSEDTLEAVYRLSNETETYVPCERTHEETVQWYMEQVNSGEMTLDEVPEDYRAEVEAQVNLTEPDTEQAIVDSIMQEVSSYGY